MNIRYFKQKVAIKICNASEMLKANNPYYDEMFLSFDFSAFVIMFFD